MMRGKKQMPNNIYSDITRRLAELKPKLLETLQNREMEVRDREEDTFQVYWKKRIEKEYASILTDLEFLLDDYINFQISLGIEIYEFLSKSSERKIKSILNLYKMDIWFEKDVFSRFKQKDNTYYRFFKDDLQEPPFLKNEDDKSKAKQKMMEKCREELIDSFHTKFEYTEQYLFKESKRLDDKLQKITKSKDKPSQFFDFGHNIVSTNPTIAMILLGVSIECLLKKNYSEIIPESMTLGRIIGILKRKRKLTNQIELLEDINTSYIKAKHEKDTIIPKTYVELFYQKATILY